MGDFPSHRNLHLIPFNYSVTEDFPARHVADFPPFMERLEPHHPGLLHPVPQVESIDPHKPRESNQLLIGGIPTPLKNMKVNWDDDIPNIWEK